MVLVRFGVINPVDVRTMSLFAHFYIVNHMHLDGKTENGILIFDLENASPF